MSERESDANGRANTRTADRFRDVAWRRRAVLTAIGGGAALSAIGGHGAASEGTRADAENGAIRTVVDFDPGDGPENLAIDSEGAVYMSIGLTGEIRKLPADAVDRTDLRKEDTELLAQLNPGEEGFLTGVVVDEYANVVYAALSSFVEGNDHPGDENGADAHGIWKVPLDEGQAELLAGLPAETLPNGLLLDDGKLSEERRLLVTDSIGGRIWSVDLVSGEATVWLDHELLESTDPELDFPIGANGVAVDWRCDLHVANTDHGRIVRVPIAEDGTPNEEGIASYIDDADALEGADGIDFHDRQLYVTANRQNEVVRVSPSKLVTTVADDADGLDFPSDVGIHRGREEAFVSNFAFLSLLDEGVESHPSLAAAPIEDVDELTRQLDLVYFSTSKYRDVDRAREDGYGADPNFVSEWVPGMGFHFINPGLMADDDIARPTILAYYADDGYDPAPGDEHDDAHDDDLVLGGVEYAVPGNRAEDPPNYFADEDAAVELEITESDGWEYIEHQDITALHAWVHRRNPAGVFAHTHPAID